MVAMDTLKATNCTLAHSHTPTHTLSHTVTLPLTHTHTHTLSHTLTRPLSCMRTAFEFFRDRRSLHKHEFASGDYEVYEHRYNELVSQAPRTPTKCHPEQRSTATAAAT